MRRPPYHRERRGPLEVKMTPMIDVIFLLLIFFICTASFQMPEEILPTRFLLPGTVASETPIDPEVLDLDEIVVKVLWRDGGPRWQINDRDYSSLAEVRAVLEAAARIKIDLPVILDIDPSVPMENVIDVYDLCRKVGLERVQFAASVAA
ncbi:MAG: biopolymer transporter ExbD [Thermoguttaceae bacterium]